jgi:hypothetical protein
MLSISPAARDFGIGVRDTAKSKNEWSSRNEKLAH